MRDFTFMRLKLCVFSPLQLRYSILKELVVEASSGVFVSIVSVVSFVSTSEPETYRFQSIYKHKLDIIVHLQFLSYSTCLLLMWKYV